MLKANGLLCEDCNNDLGSDLDGELCRQLNPLANALGLAPKTSTPDVEVEIPSPVRGEAPVVYRRTADGNLRRAKPKHELELHDDTQTGTLHVEAPDMRQARQVLLGYKRRFPKLNVEKALSRIGPKTIPYIGAVRFNLDLGGDLFFRAVAKIAVGYAIHRGVERNAVERAVSYVRGDVDASIVFPAYVPDPIGPQRRYGSHVLALRSDGASRLSAYVELFGVVRCVAVLSESWAGPPVEATYAQNLLTSEITEPTLQAWPLGLLDAGWHHDEVRRALGEFMRAAQERSIDGAIKHAVERAMGHLGEPGDLLDVEQLMPELLRELQPLVEGLVGCARLPGPGITRPRMSPNDPCWCGSGLLHRRCCGSRPR